MPHSGEGSNVCQTYQLAPETCKQKNVFIETKKKKNQRILNLKIYAISLIYFFNQEFHSQRLGIEGSFIEKSK